MYEVTAVFVDNGETRIFPSVSCALTNVYSETRVTRCGALTRLASVWGAAGLSPSFHRYDFVFSRERGSNGGAGETLFPVRSDAPLNPCIITRDISPRYSRVSQWSVAICHSARRRDARYSAAEFRHFAQRASRHPPYKGVQYRVGVALEGSVRGSNPVLVERTDALAPQPPGSTNYPRILGLLELKQHRYLVSFAVD